MILFIFLLDLNRYMGNQSKMAFLALAWAFLVFGNIIIIAFRFPRFIKKCAASASKIEYIKT